MIVCRRESTLDLICDNDFESKNRLANGETFPVSKTEPPGSNKSPEIVTVRNPFWDQI